jgi:hypothetical protein
MLAQQVERERRPPIGYRFPPRGSPKLVFPSGRQSLLVLSRVPFPYSNWVSRAGAAAAEFPRPKGADISQQHSAFAAARRGRRIQREHQSSVAVRTVFTPAQSAHRCGGAMRRPEVVQPYRRRAGTQATRTTQAAVPSARPRFQSACWFTPRCVGEMGTSSPPRWDLPFLNGQNI